MVEVETTDPAVNHWHRVGGQEGGTVTSIAMASHSDGRRLFLGTMSGVFLSDDDGQTWRISNAQLTSPYIQAITVSPDYDRDNNAFAGAVQGGVFKSFDGGETWNRLSFWGAIPNVVALALSPSYATDRIALLGTDGDGVYRTTNGGRSWNPSNVGLSGAIHSDAGRLIRLPHGPDGLCRHCQRRRVPLQ